MTKDEQIRQLIRGIGDKTASPVILGEVTEVDEQAATCTVMLSEGLEIDGVRMRSIVEDGQGFYVVPAVGSKVQLLRLGRSDDFMIVGTELYDKVIIQGDEISLVVTQENITFNNNRLGSFLLDINKLVEKVNQLESQINDLKGVLRNWTPVPQDGGAQLKIGVTTWAATDIVETTVDDVKDEKILN